MTDKHYTHTCQVCKTEFPATLNKDGSVRKRKYKTCSPFCYRVAAGHRSPGAELCRRPQYGVKVMVCCKFCKSFFGPLMPGQARRVTYCSRACNAKSQQTIRKCNYCRTDYISNRNNRMYCSQSCYFNSRALVMPEIEALRRIGELVRAHTKKREIHRLSVFSHEIEALYRIGAKIRSATRACISCGKVHIKRTRYAKMCSVQCRMASQEAARKRRRALPSTRRAKRIAKSRRRAIIRGCKHTENIDPIKVFDRDGWLCHICGIQTKREDRGGIKPEAPELDHIIPIAMGGTHTWDNVACSCRGCNIRKGAKWAGSIPPRGRVAAKRRFAP